MNLAKGHTAICIPVLERMQVKVLFHVHFTKLQIRTQREYDQHFEKNVVGCLLCSNERRGDDENRTKGISCSSQSIINVGDSRQKTQQYSSMRRASHDSSSEARGTLTILYYMTTSFFSYHSRIILVPANLNQKWDESIMFYGTPHN
eukprot:scaffold38298_cov49-Attheya_sp.AAC.7